jgi:hypothetical protein
VAHCRQLAQKGELTVPGVSPETVGRRRADVVVKLDEKRALEEYRGWLRARKGILPLSLGSMAVAVEKGWRMHRVCAESVGSLTQEGERWVTRLGIYVNALSTQARKLHVEGQFQSRSLSSLLSSLARQSERSRHCSMEGLNRKHPSSRHSSPRRGG